MDMTHPPHETDWTASSPSSLLSPSTSSQRQPAWRSFDFAHTASMPPHGAASQAGSQAGLDDFRFSVTSDTSTTCTSPASIEEQQSLNANTKARYARPELLVETKPRELDPVLTQAQTNQLATFASEMITYLWFSSITQRKTALPAAYAATESRPHPRQFRPTPGFSHFIRDVLLTTQVSRSVVVLALLFVYRLKIRNVIHGQPGSEFRLAIVAFMLANKVLDDHTYTAKTWSEVSGIALGPLQAGEIEFLKGLDFRMHVTSQHFESWQLLLLGLRNANETKSVVEQQGLRRSARVAQPVPPCLLAPRHSWQSGQSALPLRQAQPIQTMPSMQAHTPWAYSVPIPQPTRTEAASPHHRLALQHSHSRRTSKRLAAQEDAQDDIERPSAKRHGPVAPKRQLSSGPMIRSVHPSPAVNLSPAMSLHPEVAPFDQLTDAFSPARALEIQQAHYRAYAEGQARLEFYQLAAGRRAGISERFAPAPALANTASLPHAQVHHRQPFMVPSNSAGLHPQSRTTLSLSPVDLTGSRPSQRTPNVWSAPHTRMNHLMTSRPSILSPQSIYPVQQHPRPPAPATGEAFSSFANCGPPAVQWQQPGWQLDWSLRPLPTYPGLS
ncbi:hypothetical protein E5Q_01844 [Mixia osmundae IAM 14324]|uniref:Cyclin N-terminal domain-containing protein n=1 Tax=Mixia osmundae (strain CBS 9802 / IAM 14324 / JCM 22182 / KY 12970) TaxID=764103 RepID=G7DX79_MIXOS|nr:hypothetical protein E5Q_01844 [Mixia osmundae IAM 14324]